MQPNIAGPLNAQCGKCLYWEQHEAAAAMGECKRYPPQVVMVRDAGDAQLTASSEWPLTLRPKQRKGGKPRVLDALWRVT